MGLARDGLSRIGMAESHRCYQGKAGRIYVYMKILLVFMHEAEGYVFFRVNECYLTSNLSMLSHAPLGFAPRYACWFPFVICSDVGF